MLSLVSRKFLAMRNIALYSVLGEDFSNYEPEPCEKFSLDGEIAGTYSKTIQAEKFNYR